jgi:hypothetical protein
MSAHRTRTRRTRRQFRMQLRTHGRFKINHRSRSGRTGKIRATQLKQGSS